MSGPAAFVVTIPPMMRRPPDLNVEEARGTRSRTPGDFASGLWFWLPHLRRDVEDLVEDGAIG